MKDICIDLLEVKNNLTMIRKIKGITQQKLADEVGVSRQSIISIEKHNCNPSVGLAMKIAMVLKSDVGEVFELE